MTEQSLVASYLGLTLSIMWVVPDACMQNVGTPPLMKSGKIDAELLSRIIWGRGIPKKMLRLLRLVFLSYYAKSYLFLSAKTEKKQRQDRVQVRDVGV